MNCLQSTHWNPRVLRLGVALAFCLSSAGAALAAVGGPDAFGYHWIDSLEVGGPKFQAVNITAIGRLVVSGDDTATSSPPPDGIGMPVALPVPFPFYGTSYDFLTMASNGFLCTDPADTGGDLSNDCPLPVVPSSGGGARIYPLHDDLILDPMMGAGGYYQYFACCPRPADRGVATGCHIFQWNRVAHFGGGGATWDEWALLYDTGDITLQVGPGNPETGSGSTTGIQNDGATIGLTVQCNMAGTVPDNYAVTIYSPSAPRLRILNMHDTATPNYMVQAAAALDADLTVVPTRAAFNTAFDGGGWDVIVYNAYDFEPPGIPELNRLNAHALAGKRVLLNSWNLTAALAHPLLMTTCPVSIASSYNTPVPIFAWIPGHSAFRLPRVVTPNPIGTTGADPFNVDGHNGQPLAGSFAVGGSTMAPAANSAGIIISCDYTVVLNLFTPQLQTQAPTIDLLIDEISMGRRGGILVWDDTTRAGALTHQQTFADAAQFLGFAPTLATSQASFTAWLPLACWDLVVADVGGVALAMGSLDLVRNYLNAGNPVIFGHWNATAFPGHALFAQEGITLGSTFGAGESVFSWPPTSPLFTTPQSVPNFGPTNPAVTYGVYGHDHTTAPNMTVGGFTPAAGARGGVSFGASGRFIYNSFAFDAYGAIDSDGDGVDDVKELAINEIFSLVGGCGTFCGDCDTNGLGPSILDSLAAAKIAAGILVATAEQMSCCDVNSIASISVVDALLIAQSAAGIPVGLSCP